MLTSMFSGTGIERPRGQIRSGPERKIGTTSSPGTDWTRIPTPERKRATDPGLAAAALGKEHHRLARLQTVGDRRHRVLPPFRPAHEGDRVEEEHRPHPQEPVALEVVGRRHRMDRRHPPQRKGGHQHRGVEMRVVVRDDETGPLGQRVPAAVAHADDAEEHRPHDRDVDRVEQQLPEPLLHAVHA